MDGQTLHGLVQRLDRLERENRWLKRIGAVVLAGLTAVILTGQATLRKVPRVVEAEKFVLKDAKGDVRGMLMMAPDGSPSLALFGQGTVLLSVGADGEPSLALLGKDKKGVAAIGVGSDGSPGLAIMDKSGKLRAAMGSVKHGPTRTPIHSLTLFNKDGKVVWKAP